MNSNYFCVGETVKITNGYLTGEIGWIDAADGDEYRVCVENDDISDKTWKDYEDLEPVESEPAPTSEPTAAPTNALPKLSKAQQEAWENILEWYAQEDRDDDFNGYEVRVHSNTLEAMKNKGVLSSVWSGFISPMPRYTIHPDYLPTPEPKPEHKVQLRYHLGDKVCVLTGKWAGAECTISGVNKKWTGDTYYRVTDNNGDEGSIWYEATELEPVATPEGEPDTTANDTINDTDALEMALELARQENAKLTSQLEALKAYVGEMKTRRDIDIARLIDTISDLREERDNMKAIIIDELQAAIDNAAPGMRLAEIEQYIIDNTKE